jgi:DNA polymerase III epsilon subunit-like protein
MTTNYILPIDSETCNIVPTETVTPGNNLTYDIGFKLVKPSTGEEILRRSYVVREIFFGETERMKSSYYAEKLPRYYKDIAEGKREVKSFFEIMNEISAICKRYNVVGIVAHNARFDVDALNTTARWLTGLDYVRALPDVEIWDSMKMWNACKPARYADWCEENGYMTKHRPPRVRLTAEIIYRFITGDDEFIESHTALEDVDIETEIIMACYKSHKPMAEARALYHKKG